MEIIPRAISITGVKWVNKKTHTEKDTLSERDQQLSRTINKMRTLTEGAGAAARYCTNMLGAKSLHENVVESLNHVADRLLADLEHSLSIEHPEKPGVQNAPAAASKAHKTGILPGANK